MKLLNGADLAGYIKERQVTQVRTLVQTHGVQPKLAIIQCQDIPVINTYVRLKKRYGADIGVEVDIYNIPQNQAPALIKKLGADATVHGIIVQLPLPEPDQTDQLVNLVAPTKDVDALGAKAQFTPATPMAIMWLLAGYNIELKDRHILLVGRGKLVGQPLEKLLKVSGLDVEVVGADVKDLKATALAADIIITATGSPALLTSEMIKPEAIVVDAGVASEGAKTVGDLDPAVYDRQDLTITPAKGGVGPLTVCALFDNVIRSARGQTPN